MKKVALVWWSGSGNTHEMADAVQEGLEAGGVEVVSVEAGDFDTDSAADYDGFAFGCPAMGAEELESSEFLPMWDAVVEELSDKPVVLFGSYGWGDGEWMESWREDAEAAGVNIVNTLIVNETPDAEGKEECVNLGKELASK